MSAELIVLPNQASSMIQAAVQHRRMMVEFTQQVMVQGVDYGIIPGTNKPTLLKPGAEKLCTLFSFVPKFTILKQIEDWTGEAFGGEPFFFYLVRCSLWRNGELVVEADASCNSREKRYRYRRAERTCPTCNQAAIIKGKAEWGGGWVCFKNKGGCGAKFPDGDASIEKQETGQILNPDIYDCVNTIIKQAEKRAVIAATLLGANASEFYGQDLDAVHLPPQQEQVINTETGEISTRSVAPDPVDSRPLKERLAERLRKVQADKSILKPICLRLMKSQGKTVSSEQYEWCLSDKTIEEWIDVVIGLKAEGAQRKEAQEAAKPEEPAVAVTLTPETTEEDDEGDPYEEVVEGEA